MDAQAVQPNFSPFNGGFPLNLANKAAIPQVVFNTNSGFDIMDNAISTFDNYKDVLKKARKHDVTTKDILVQLLAMYFK